MDEQFGWYVDQATAEVYERGLEATPQAVMFYCFGKIDSKLDARVIRFDGKLMGSLLLTLGTIVGGTIGTLLGG